jgi:DNA-binding NarL/FixJ family response regulator
MAAKIGRFGFTKAEDHIAQCIKRGERLYTIAASRSVAESTVRKQLQVVFEKTKTNHQTQLAVLLLTTDDNE